MPWIHFLAKTKSEKEAEHELPYESSPKSNFSSAYVSQFIQSLLWEKRKYVCGC